MLSIVIHLVSSGCEGLYEMRGFVLDSSPVIVSMLHMRVQCKHPAGSAEPRSSELSC